MKRATLTVEGAVGSTTPVNHADGVTGAVEDQLRTEGACEELERTRDDSPGRGPYVEIKSKMKLN